MIDYIKASDCGLDTTELGSIMYLKLLVSVDPDTGEAPRRNRNSTYNSITISISPDGIAGVSGASFYIIMI